MAAMFVYRSKRNEHSLQRTFHRCFLSRFGSFCKAVSDEKIFRNPPIRNKNCLWRPYLLMDRDKISNLHRGPAIDASTKFRIIWPNSFRGEEFFKSTNQKQESPVVAMFVIGSGRNEQSLQRTFHRCMLPGFGAFGKAVAEEKIFFLEINRSETRIVCGGHVC